MWKELLRKGQEKVPAVWDAEVKLRSTKYHSVLWENESDHIAEV